MAADPACDLALLPPSGPLVVAVSGGADSMALWGLLAEAERWRLHIFHLDHGLRGESPLDAALVAGCDLPGERHVERIAIADRAREWGVGLEEAGRRARYERLYAVARSCAAPVVVTAHHRDDQAETVLMNLLRGSHGVVGMPQRRAIGPGVDVVRPLLGASRGDLRAYLMRRGIPWREDASNCDQAFTRNRLRLRVLPELEAAAPGFTTALCAAVGPVASSPGRDLIRRLGANATRATVRRLDGLAEGQRTTLGGYLIRRRHGQLVAEEEFPRPLGDALLVTGPGRWRRGDAVMTIASPGPCADPRQGLWLSRCSWPLHWRPVAVGERWRPLGCAGRQLVGKSLAERGISQRQRQDFPVLADAQGVVCIPTLGLVAERCRVYPGDSAWALALTPAEDDDAP